MYYTLLYSLSTIHTKYVIYLKMVGLPCCNNIKEQKKKQRIWMFVEKHGPSNDLYLLYFETLLSVGCNDTYQSFYNPWFL